MECIECRLVEANKESGLCNDCEEVEQRKINGLLYLPALGLVLGLIGGAMQLYDFFGAVLKYYNKTGFLSWFSIGGVIMLLSAFLISVYAAWLFFRRKMGTRRVMIIYYISGLMLALYLTVLPGALFGMKLEQGDIRVLISSLFGVFIWVPYFIFLKRINRVFCH
ncbi:DUF2569 domain-containing protein [Pantoea ananatis]|uniref:DUF2569 domain-containing protein n=1 Tax=Pantoea ananas TaxID=553 RepID=UPI00158F645B|nr:DUF2569 domain-containing protein [Pantoea ananatis]MBA4823314.1 DUF2569 domain-containing protein [Pantoea ananatis]QKV87460.1 DUF2569 domain-containing protein [Pantoea ananatis]